MYSITEVEQSSGISAFTLRYYDKCGFFPNIQRDSRNRRKYSDADINRLQLIESLRVSGLSIDGIKAFLGNLDAGKHEAVQQVLEYQVLRLELLRDQIDNSGRTLKDFQQRLKTLPVDIPCEIGCSEPLYDVFSDDLHSDSLI